MKLIAILVIALIFITPYYVNGNSWRAGTFVNYQVPMFGLGEWYSSAPDLGLNLIKINSGTGIGLEYHYSKFSHGSLEEKSFQWQVDKKYYRSPRASASMSIHRFLVNFLFMKQHRSVFGQTFQPYLLLGAGFYAYDNKVSGLIYPGQGKRPLDDSLLLPPISDKQVALGSDVGFGFAADITANISLDLHLRYHVILGTIRPLEDWGLKEIFPLQTMDIGLGLQFRL